MRAVALLVYAIGVLDVVRGMVFSIPRGSYRLECTEKLRCSEADRLRWTQRKEDVQKLLMLANISKSDRYILRNSPLLSAMNSRADLCKDHQTAGFLLSNESEIEWSVACLWTGGDASASCALAPIRNKPIGYIHARLWRKMLYDFRKAIGCSDDEIKAANKVDEVYFCTERCTQAGFGYLYSMLMTCVLFVSIMIFFVSP